MKRSCQSNPMHINGLPEDLAENILTRLPIQEAVKTSVLSKKWRYAWRKLPQLVFDERFCDESIRNSKSKIIAAVSHVLLFHRGPLLKFTLSLSELGGCPAIDRFILVVLEAGVKQLTLRIRNGEIYRLPSSIYAYGQQLERLELRCCVIKPYSGFEVFSKLKDLELEEVRISGNVVSSLIRNCPLLESFYFCSSTECGCLQIFSPNLEKFFFVGLCESLSFVNTPKLEYIQFFTYGPEEIEASNPPALRGRLLVRELEVDYLYSKSLIAMSTVANELSHLNILTLSDTCFGILDEVFTTLCLIRNCKNLKKLAIYMCGMCLRDHTHDIELKEIECYSDVTLEHLREVKLNFVSGLKCEMQLIELILAKSPVLEKFVIRLWSRLDDSEKLRFDKKVLMFQRASPLVEVDYKD